jgi:tetratricopeptide (TPR) repeat protein
MRCGRILIAAIFMSALIGCSAVGVVSSSDPEVKFGQAQELVRQGRFMPAQRLLQEAQEIYEKRGDEAGLAETYRQFGFFYRAPIPRGSLVPDDFVGATNGIASRDIRAMEYFQKSLALFRKLGKLDMESNLHFVMGQTYAGGLNDKSAACGSFQSSLEVHRKALQQDPGLRVDTGPYRSLDEIIAKARQEVGC